ncbi:PEP-CTERM sorting domain-containing protein [Colwellia sp. 6_MG-2023]|uniref:PEP-CTERM sorting domain-containing protein n=1 Tax=Colwellia sp. 6_MG-2023 TaxID=3062676 RepID=UPI0026E2A826|nr:PEP-CTERM sorting domain-containing protein [Colwellia sp. 6_MG-2023]MDO6487210.1 PEP-CTERM sorting domain-containing protein [Colwellia sp. 6_MG-2023]
MEKVYFKVMILSLLISACSLFNLANATLMLNIDLTSGKLLGASNININGKLYDVSFVDGTCPDLFSGCDEQSDFSWQTEEESKVASLALLNDVFVDSVDGLFDSLPDLTFGCSSDTYNDCFVITPYKSNTNNTLFGVMALNNSNPNWDTTSPFTVGIGLNTGISNSSTYAVWSSPKPLQAVTEPTTLTIFALGLIGLTLRRCNKES